MSVTKEKWKVFFINFGIKLLFLIIIFAPISVLILFNYNWQIVTLGLVASALFSFICGINKFQTFKIGRDGVEVKKAVEEAKDILGELNESVRDYLYLNLLSTNKIGINEDIEASIDELEIYEAIIKKHSISDSKVKTQLEKYRISILSKSIEKIVAKMNDIELSVVSTSRPDMSLIEYCLNNNEIFEPHELKQ
ncbi:TPA: hypothetical protein U0F76_002447, partial [Listeria monocytogenes]|nr:hypothetical protein [Listeria monocytogenes]